MKNSSDDRRKISYPKGGQAVARGLRKDINGEEAQTRKRSKGRINKKKTEVKTETVKLTADKIAGLPQKKERSHKVIIKVENVWKHFGKGEKKIPVLRDIDVTFYSGEFAIIFGPSGCGKSTLLHTMLGLEKPDAGRVYLRGNSLYQMKDDSRLWWRREKIGIVFQQSNWIKSLSVIENVEYPLYLSRMGEDEIRKKALEMIELVGMTKNINKNPTELSGGEQQKVALARALITDPGIIVADEPTGNLDSKSSIELIRLLAKLNRIDRKAVIMVTHDSSFLPLANRRVFLQDGKVIKDEHD